MSIKTKVIITVENIETKEIAYCTNLEVVASNFGLNAQNMRNSFSRLGKDYIITSGYVIRKVELLKK